MDSGEVVGTSLIGRGEALGLVRDVAAGRRAGLVLVGAPGLGKSALLREAAAAATPGTRVLEVSGAPGLAAVPLGAFAHLLPPGHGQAGTADMLAALAQLPELLAGGDPPALLLVDDAHDLDVASAALLRRLVASRAVRAVVALRPGALPEDVERLLERPPLLRHDLQPLDDAASVELVTRLAGPVERLSARRLVERAAGNPLYLTALVETELAAGRLAAIGSVRHWRGGPVPTGVAALVQRRLATLTAGEPEALEMAALAGEMPPAVLVAECGEPTVAQLLTKGVLAVGPGGGLRPAHPLIGEVVVAAVAPWRTAEVRRRVAHALVAGERGPVSDATALRAAVLSVDAGDALPEAVALRAAAVATTRLDPGLALRLARAAEPSDRTRLAQGQALLSLGRLDEAADVLAPVSTSGAVPAQSRTAAVTVHALALSWSPGRATDAVRLVDAALAGEPDQALRGQLRGIRVAALCFAGRMAESAAEGRALLAEGVPLAGVATGAFATALQAVGDADDALRLVDQAERGAVAVLDSWLALRTMRSLLALSAGDIQGAVAVADELTARGLAEGWGAAVEVGLVLAGSAELVAGRSARAASLLAEARALGGFHDFGGGVLVAARLARARALAGDRAAQAAAEEVRAALSGPARDAFGKPLAEIDLAVAEVALGAEVSGLRRLSAVARRALADGRRGNAAAALLERARITTRPADVRRAAEAARGLHWEHALRLVGHVEALSRGDAVELEGLAERWERKGLVALAGEALAHAAASSQQREQAREAARLSAALHQLVTSGLTPYPWWPVGSPDRPLTGREREIALLASRGWSNRQIADRLVLSVRTVENHLQRAYDKLGVSGRAGLASALGSLKGRR